MAKLLRLPLALALTVILSMAAAGFAQSGRTMDRQRPQRHDPKQADQQTAPAKEDADTDTDTRTDATDAIAEPVDENDDLAEAAPDPGTTADPAAAAKTFTELKTPDIPADFKGCGYIFAVESGDPAWETKVRSAVSRLPQRIPAETVYRTDNLYTLQSAVNNLKARNVKKIVFVPLYLNSSSDSLNRLKYMLGFRQNPADGDSSPGGGISSTNAKRVEIKTPTAITTALDDSAVYANAVARRMKNYSRGRPVALLLVGGGLNSDADNRAKLETLNRIATRVVEKSACSLAQGFLLRPRQDSRRTLGKPDMEMQPDSFSRSGIYGDNGRLIREADQSANERASAELFKKTAQKLSSRYAVAVAGYSISSRELDKTVQTELADLFYNWLGNIELTEADVQAWIINKLYEGIELPPVELAGGRQAGKLSPQEQYDRTRKEWQ